MASLARALLPRLAKAQKGDAIHGAEVPPGVTSPEALEAVPVQVQGVDLHHLAREGGLQVGCAPGERPIALAPEALAAGAITVDHAPLEELAEAPAYGAGAGADAARGCQIVCV